MVKNVEVEGNFYTLYDLRPRGRRYARCAISRLPRITVNSNFTWSGWNQPKARSLVLIFRRRLAVGHAQRKAAQKGQSGQQGVGQDTLMTTACRSVVRAVRSLSERPTRRFRRHVDPDRASSGHDFLAGTGDARIFRTFSVGRAILERQGFDRKESRRARKRFVEADRLRDGSRPRLRGRAPRRTKDQEDIE